MSFNIQDEALKKLSQIENNETPETKKVKTVKAANPKSTSHVRVFSAPAKSFTGLMRRGRAIWFAIVNKGKKDIIKFRSPALVGVGDMNEQAQQAFAAAEEKACDVTGLDRSEFILKQAGGHGEYWDEEDAKLKLP